MTTKEKAERIREYCENRGECACEDCPLVDFPEEGCFESCLSDYAIERNYGILFGKSKTSEESGVKGMTFAQKRDICHSRCRVDDCENCPLVGEKWEHKYDSGIGGDYCLCIEDATEDELDRALALFEGAPVKPDPDRRDYWANVCAIQKRQTEKGVRTYGQRLEDNKSLTPVQRLEYLEEELIDALMYIEHIKTLFPKEVKE